MARTSSLSDAIRARKLLVALIAASAIALGLLSATQAYAEPILERQTQEHPRWSEAAAFTYSVPVNNNSTIYPNGSVRPMGEPAYFRSISPAIPVRFSWRAEDLGELRGNVTGNLTLRVQADAGQGRSYWEARHLLDTNATRDPLEGIRLAGVIDLDAEVAEAGALLQQMPPGDGHVNWSVEARIGYDLQRASGAERAESVFVLPIQVSDPRIVMPGADALRWTRPHTDITTTTSSHAAGWDGVLGALPALALLVLGGALLASIAWAEAAGDRSGLLAEIESQKEWITRAAGPLQPAQMPQPMIDVASLQDLVQAASDARTRVVLDESTRICYAIALGVTYRYAAQRRGKAALRPSVPAGPGP